MVHQKHRPRKRLLDELYGKMRGAVRKKHSVALRANLAGFSGDVWREMGGAYLEVGRYPSVARALTVGHGKINTTLCHKAKKNPWVNTNADIQKLVLSLLPSVVLHDRPKTKWKVMSL